MENDLPIPLMRHLEELGVMPKSLPDDVPDDPRFSYKFRMPIFDENGEPDF